jgi:adenylate cyclase class 2
LRRSEQTDTYFTSFHKDFKKSDEALRLRESRDSSGKTEEYMTYKGPREDKSTVSRKELEIPVENASLALAFLCALSFTPAFKVHKKREYFGLGDITLSLDEIERLGFFLEMEVMTEKKEDIAKISRRLFSLAEKLGLSKSRSIQKSYLELILEKEDKRI